MLKVMYILKSHCYVRATIFITSLVVSSIFCTSTTSTLESTLPPISPTAATFTSTQTATMSPTQTQRPTKTPKPTLTYTPTLSPGQFPFSAADVKLNIYDMWGIECIDIGPGSKTGFYWECRGKNYYDLVRVISFGNDANSIEFIQVYVLNPFDPADYKVIDHFTDVIGAVFDNQRRDKFETWLLTNLPTLNGLGDEIIDDNIDDFDISISGPGVCRVLRVGKMPIDGLDLSVIPNLGELEDLCGYK